MKCDTGHHSEGAASCTCGVDTIATLQCVPDTCEASSVPTNGQIGDCTSTLAHDASCTPTCNTGYTMKGTRSCHLGRLDDDVICIKSIGGAGGIESRILALEEKYDKIDKVCLSDTRRSLSAISPCGHGSNDGNDADMTDVEFAVTHTIDLQGISATQFNTDPLIVESFRETVSTLLDVPLTDIFNIQAISANRRRRSLSIQKSFHFRNLETTSCSVTYSIKVESQKQMEELTSELTTTFSDSTVFTKELQKTMTTNNVISVSPSSISADTTKLPEAAGSKGKNTTSAGGVIAAVVGCVLSFVVVAGIAFYMYQKKQLHSKLNNEPPSIGLSSIELFKIQGSTNSMNPMNQTGNANPVVSTPPPPPPPPIEIHTELPLNWQQVEGVDGPQSNYYWNTVTNVTQYDRPK